MFGFSFGELVVLVIVAIVVIGPKDLPKVLRKLGQWSGKLRRMASDLRAQSGIDEVLRGEGLGADLAEIRKLARGELDTVTRGVTFDGVTHDHADPYAFTIEREREHPRDGPDSYGALPDDAIVYAETLPVSVHAQSPLYVHGDANAVIEVPAPAPALAEADHDRDLPAEPLHDEPEEPGAKAIVATPPEPA